MIEPNTRGENARRSGALSKAPKTAEDKSHSSKNALRDGRAAGDTVVLRNENPETWREVLATHINRYKPVDGIERDLVEDIAFCRWRLRRFRGVDTALWDMQMDDQSNQFAARYETSDEAVRLAFAFRNDANLQLASRYEGRLRRSYERALRNLAEYRTGARASGEKRSKRRENFQTNPAQSQRTNNHSEAENA